MCHIDNFRDYDKTIATYGVLRGTGDLLQKVKIFITLIMVILNNLKELLRIKEQT